MTESKFEQRWSRKAEARGWFALKNIQTNANGWPDRMYMRDGKVFFAEFKSTHGRLSKLQEYRIKKIRENGFHVLILKEKL